MRRIGIDVRYLSHGLIGGVHTYVRHFVPALIDIAEDCEILLYADTKRPFELTGLPPHVTVRLLPWRNPLSTIRHDALLWRQMQRDRLDIVHFPANYGLGPPGIPMVLTVHDAINLLPMREIVRGHPKQPGTIAKMTYLHAWTRFSARRAALVLTVSQHAGRAIALHGGLQLSQIVPIPHAPTPDLRRITDRVVLDDVRHRHRLNGPFVVADALKNPTPLVQAWRRLSDEVRGDRRLVFFSRRVDVPSIVLEAVERGEARLLLRPSREDLIALYSLADAFVFPSWMEGFGIPLLEAMTCGAPVIASDRGAIPEVVGDAALLADADDADMFARHLQRVFCDPGEAEGLRERGYARVANFSWQSTAQQVLASYERAFQERSSVTQGSLRTLGQIGRLPGRG